MCVATSALALSFLLVGCDRRGFPHHEQQREPRRHCQNAREDRYPVAGWHGDQDRRDQKDHPSRQALRAKPEIGCGFTANRARPRRRIGAAFRGPGRLVGRRHGTAGAGDQERQLLSCMGRQFEGVFHPAARVEGLVVAAAHRDVAQGNGIQLAGDDLLQVRAGVGREEPNRIQDGILVRSAGLGQDGHVQRAVAVRVGRGEHDWLRAGAVPNGPADQLPAPGRLRPGR